MKVNSDGVCWHPVSPSVLWLYNWNGPHLPAQGWHFQPKAEGWRPRKSWLIGLTFFLVFKKIQSGEEKPRHVLFMVLFSSLDKMKRFSCFLKKFLPNSHVNFQMMMRWSERWLWWWGGSACLLRMLCRWECPHPSTRPRPGRVWTVSRWPTTRWATPKFYQSTLLFNGHLG